MTPALLALLALAAPGPATDTATAASAGDRQVERSLQRTFAQIPALRSVRVTVTASVATLTGSVIAAEDDRAAVKIAEAQAGVVFVRDEVDVDTDVDTRVVPAIEKAEELVKRFVAMLPVLGLSLAVLLVAWVVGRFVGELDPLYRRVDQRPFVGRLVRRIVRGLVLLAAFLIVFELLGITALVGALLGTAGVAGLAVGFAFKDIIENYLAGVMLSLRHPFRTGDLVELEGVQGKLVRLTSRDTVLMTLEGNHVRIPNADVFKAKITNYTLNPRRRFDFTVGVGTQENLLQVRTEALDVLRSIDGVLHDPAPRFLIDSLGDSSVVVHLYAWVDQSQADFLAVRTEAVRRVKVALEDNGHDLPEPIYRVVLRQAPEPAAGPPRAKEAIEDDSMLAAPSVQSEIDDQIAEEQTDSTERNLLGR